MVGRERERERLRADFADVVASADLPAVHADRPGGRRQVAARRRLPRARRRQRATVARGRALSYGEGITYWPLVEILIQLGVEPAEAIRSSPADTQLATRALLERLAEEQPLVLVLDDLHWAEPPMLDLVEHVADWSRSAPIFLLCVARPELLDVRPGWGGGKLNATSVLLEPLADWRRPTLVDALLDGRRARRRRRGRASSRRPRGTRSSSRRWPRSRARPAARVEVPPTIQALLQARLDTLGDERADA